MKKYWRCFVCNDIHYGVKPPEIYPTSQAKNAYMEISSAEAETMCRTAKANKAGFEKNKFRQAIEKFTEKNEENDEMFDEASAVNFPELICQYWLIMIYQD